jgi:hypothetical protein
VEAKKCGELHAVMVILTNRSAKYIVRPKNKDTIVNGDGK